MVVTGMESNTVLERWVFNVETAREAATNPQYVRPHATVRPAGT